MAYEQNYDKCFDDEFISLVDKRIQSKEPHVVLSVYRVELFHKQFHDDCGRNWPHTYDIKRL